MSIGQSLQSSKVFISFLALLVVLGVGYSVSQAVLLDGPDILTVPPASVELTGVTNSNQQAFNERKAVPLTAPVQCERNFLQPSEVPIVDSHMIFYNETLSGTKTDANEVWTFEGDIVCVLAGDSLQLQTDSIFGNPGTVYPGEAGRGMEAGGSDTWEVINGNQIKVTMTDEGPGDRLRVLTRWVEPPDTTAPEVSCVAGKGGVYELLATDDRDESVLVFLTDSTGELSYGPYEPGTTIKFILAKGAQPNMRAMNNQVDFQIKSPTDLFITAKDSAGNESSAPCTGG